MNLATTGPRCPFCGSGADALRLTQEPRIGAVVFQLAVECAGCQETFRVVWRGRHADHVILRYAYTVGMPVSQLRQVVRWRDQALRLHCEDNEPTRRGSGRG